MSSPPSMIANNVIQEADQIIYGDREKTYGSPGKNLTRIAEQWSLYLKQKYRSEFGINAEDVCWMMSQLKMVRQMNESKRDNLVDSIGYIALIERLENEDNGNG